MPNLLTLSSMSGAAAFKSASSSSCDDSRRGIVSLFRLSHGLCARQRRSHSSPRSNLSLPYVVRSGSGTHAISSNLGHNINGRPSSSSPREWTNRSRVSKSRISATRRLNMHSKSSGRPKDGKSTASLRMKEWIERNCSEFARGRCWASLSCRVVIVSVRSAGKSSRSRRTADSPNVRPPSDKHSIEVFLTMEPAEFIDSSSEKLKSDNSTVLRCGRH